jgi:hypothetical protein
MHSGVDLDALERRTYLAACDNGLWDILLGVFLAGTGAAVMLDAGWMAGAFGGPAAAVWIVLHRRIRDSRVGYVRLASRRTRWIRWGPWLLCGGMAVVLAALMLAPNAAGAGAGYLLFAIPIAAAGYVYQNRRFYTYAGLFVLAAVADVMLPFRMPWILVATGATIAAIGAWVLVAYLGRYPAAPAEADA